MNKKIGVVGLGKMGKGIAQQLLEKGWKVVGNNRSPEKIDLLIPEGLIGAYTLNELVEKLETPRVILLVLPAGETIDKVLFDEGGLVEKLNEGDTIIDFGNSNYKDTQRRFERLDGMKIKFFDVGISGGPSGARNGACLMIGGDTDSFRETEDLYKSLAGENYMFFEGVGAGHFVKMVHNGIEYGMMQAIAEGFDVLKNSPYNLNLVDAAKIYNRKSVIESRLIEWTKQGYEEFGIELDEVSGSAGQGGGGAGIETKGEADWTVDYAIEKNISAKVIQDSIEARKISRKKPSYQGKIINMIRNKFGGHALK